MTRSLVANAFSHCVVLLLGFFGHKWVIFAFRVLVFKIHVLLTLLELVVE